MHSTGVQQSPFLSVAPRRGGVYSLIALLALGVSQCGIFDYCCFSGKEQEIRRQNERCFKMQAMVLESNRLDCSTVRQWAATSPEKDAFENPSSIRFLAECVAAISSAGEDGVWRTNDDLTTECNLKLPKH